MQVVQVATFPASQAYLSNRELFKDALDVIASSEGHIRLAMHLKGVDQADRRGLY